MSNVTAKGEDGNGVIDILAEEASGALLVKVVSGNPGGSGTADTLETTQLLVQAAVEEIEASIGTVVASPTQYTVLDRLKTLSLSKAHSDEQTTTRQNNATPYGAGDMIGALAPEMEFTSMGDAGTHVEIRDAALRIDMTTVPGGMANFKLHLYNQTKPDAAVDNAVWALSTSPDDRPAYLGYISLGTPVDVGNTLYVQSTQNKVIKLGATSSIFGVLVTDGGFTPEADTVLTVTLTTVSI